MNDHLMRKVDKLWRKLHKLTHIDQLDVLAELNWRCREVAKEVEELQDEHCVCGECGVCEERFEEQVVVEKRKEVINKLRAVSDAKRHAEGEGQLIEVTDSSSTELKEKVFNAVWTMLAEEGRCDALGHVDYRRVLTDWRAAGSPLKKIKKFILARV